MSKDDLFDEFSGMDDYFYAIVFDSIFSKTKGTNNEQRAD